MPIKAYEQKKIKYNNLLCYNYRARTVSSVCPEDDRPLAEVRVNMYNVYFAKSLKNKKIYCGYTIKDPEIRVNEHNEGNTQWSRNNRPLKLIYFESFIKQV